MFRVKKKQQSISPEEEARLRGAITGNPQIPVQTMQQPFQTIQTPQEVKLVSKTPTQYFISKKEFVKERKTITTDSGQIIELPEETTRAMTKEVYLLTAEDMVEILKSVDNSTNLYKVILQMLMGKM
jgi:hypothetical protein